MGDEIALPSPFNAEPLGLTANFLAPASMRSRRARASADPAPRAAAMIDHRLVVAVTAAVIVEAIINNRHQLAISVPPPLGGNSSYPSVGRAREGSAT